MKLIIGGKRRRKLAETHAFNNSFWPIMMGDLAIQREFTKRRMRGKDSCTILNSTTLFPGSRRTCEWLDSAMEQSSERTRQGFTSPESVRHEGFNHQGG
jgi:hypothetical protein